MAARARTLEITAEKVLREIALMGFANIMDYVTPQEDGTAYVNLSALTREVGLVLAAVCAGWWWHTAALPDRRAAAARGALAASGAVEAAIGLPMGPPELSVLDDPTSAPEEVRRQTDDEGRTVARRWLLRNGIVEQPLGDATWSALSAALTPGAGGGIDVVGLGHAGGVPGGAGAASPTSAEGGRIVSGQVHACSQATTR